MRRNVGFATALVFCFSGESAAQNQNGLTRRLLTTRIEVNNASGLFLIDTGSDCTIIDSAFARRLGLKSSGTALVERNYSTEEHITTTAEHVRIGAKTWSSVPLVVLDLTMLSRMQTASISGILGTDLLASMTMRRSHQGLPKSLMTSNRARCRLHCTEFGGGILFLSPSTQHRWKCFLIQAQT